MAPSSPEPVDLLDLKLLPAWVKEPGSGPDYTQYEGADLETAPEAGRRAPRRDGGRRRQRPRPAKEGPSRRHQEGKLGRRKHERQHSRHAPPERNRTEQERTRIAPDITKQVEVRFLPHPPALESVVHQIKENALAYSVFALARLFLEKPERYDVRLAAKPDATIWSLGADGAISLDRSFLETNAFRFAQKDFYGIEVTQSEPIKGNFTSVARCRASGLVLGPPNHHAYQPRLRNLYEQRFSRRMSFPEYQRQIEMVTDPAVVEKWKEEARNVTTFTTLDGGENPASFTNASEAERHFKQNYLPGLVTSTAEVTVTGGLSRQLPDRVLRRFIEDSWARETRSPSQMMQELVKAFREAGLHIFRHRRGMLFVSPIRVRALAQDQTTLSPQVSAVLQMLGENPRLNRKDLAEKLLAGVTAEEIEARKLSLAADLRWLISEGYVIEFNDGSLDLPRVKAKETEKKEPEGEVAASNEKSPSASSAIVDEQEAVPAFGAELENGGLNTNTP